MSLPDDLRTAILRSKLTRYRIAIDAGVDHAVLRRFLDGKRDIKLQTAGRLAEVLGFELRKVSRRAKRATDSPARRKSKKK